MIVHIKKYFKERQTPAVLFLHLSIALLVIVQILNSNFMQINSKGIISDQWFAYYSTWGHFITGILALIISTVFIFVVLSKHGFVYFFPYIVGDFTQLKNDLVCLKEHKMPEANPRGLATSIQGLGLGAIALTATSGAIWFGLWLYGKRSF